MKATWNRRRQLLDAGADVNQTTEYGWTPLLTATNNRHYKLGAYLLERGADPNIANKGGWTPLYLATDNRNIEGGDYPVPKPDMDHLEYIKLLLDHGADPNARVKDNTLTRTIFTMQWFYEAGATPFIRAAQSSDTALMKLLLEYGADPFMRHRQRRHRADGRRRHRLGGRRHLRAIAEGKHRSDEDAAGSRPRSERRQPRRPHAADGRGAEGPQRGRPDARGPRRQARHARQRQPRHRQQRLEPAGHTWQALDYADGLVRVGVQSAVTRPETAALLRKLMTERGLPVPPPNRVIESICVVEICQERTPKKTVATRAVDHFGV